MDGERDACKVLVEKCEEYGLVGRPRSKWMNNIELDVGEIRGCGMDWIDMCGRIGTNEGFF
jgi:hypothetical protein